MQHADQKLDLASSQILEGRAPQLRQYLRVAGPSNLLGVAGMLALYLEHRNITHLIFAIAVMFNGALYWIAYRRISTHGVARAAPVICYGMWLLALTVVIAADPRGWGISIMLLLMPVIAVVPYVPQRVLLRLCLIVTGLAAILSIAVAMDWSLNTVTDVPDRSIYAVLSAGTVVCVVVCGVSLWHISRNLNSAFLRLANGNRGLADTQKLLESRVAARSQALQDSHIELEKKRDAALVSSQHKSAFLANMSHELRTPLNAILGFSEALNAQVFGELSPQQREYVGNVNDAGKNLLTLINSILTEAKIAAGQYRLRKEPLDLTEVLDQSIKDVRVRHPAIRIDLHWSTPRKSLSTLGDRVTLHIAFRNLIEWVGSGQVGITAGLSGHHLEVRIDSQPKDSDLSGQEAAAGIELSATANPALELSQSLIQMHEGSLSSAAADGSSGRLLVRLPIEDEETSN